MGKVDYRVAEGTVGSCCMLVTINGQQREPTQVSLYSDFGRHKVVYFHKQ